VAILSSAFRVLRSIFITATVTLFFIFAAFVYTRIYLVVIKMVDSQNNTQSVAAPEENITRKKRFLQEIKQAKSCFLVVMCYFILCFLPVTLALTVVIRGNQFQVQTFYAWTTTLSMLNCSANSLIFFWTKTMLRREAVKMLKSVLNHSP
jgi:pheromone shutdown protein TraB